MVHWIYILKCENDIYYVGETKRLYRRFWEHQSGRGGKNTQEYKPETIIAIYPIHKLYNFIIHNTNVNTKNYNTGYNIFFNRGGVFEYFNEYNKEDEYDHLMMENYIIEKLMIDNKDKWKNYKGGKYTKNDVNYKFPINNNLYELPNCYCGYPCDIKKNDNEDYLYFRCSKKICGMDLLKRLIYMNPVIFI